jgi:hypothetical protein
MRSAVILIAVWFFALAALSVGVWRGADPFGTLYVGLGVLGICVANVLMVQHRRLARLEHEFELLRRRQPT